MEVDGKTTGTYDGVIHVICDNKGKTVYVTTKGTVDDKFVSLDDCLMLIGYDEEKDGVVIVIIDDMCRGKVYSYGNYAPNTWYEYGSTIGYA